MSSLVLLKVLLFVEAGFTAFLVAVLIAIRPYFRSQTFFCRWMWAWTAHAAFLAVGLWPNGGGWGSPVLKSFFLLASEILGLLFVPLLVAGAEAFRHSGHDAKVARLGMVAALAGAVALYILSMLTGDARLSLWLRTVPREIAVCGALWYCTYVFYRSWRQTSSGGVLLAMLSCGCYGAVQTLFALLTARGGAFRRPLGCAGHFLPGRDRHCDAAADSGGAGRVRVEGAGFRAEIPPVVRAQPGGSVPLAFGWHADRLQ